MPDDFTDLESSYDSPPALTQECNTFKWKVQVIDDDSSIESKMVTSRDVWKLQYCKVIVHFDEDSGQPVGDAAGLLGSWLGQLSNDVHLLPINYSYWRTVAPHIKDKSRFWFADPIRRKKYVMGALGSRCKDVKLRLWKEHKRNDQAATLQNRPKDVPEDQWSHLVHIRFTDKWKSMKDRNTQNQSKHKTPHVCGRKSFGRRRHEIKIKTRKHHLEQRCSLLHVRNMMEALHPRRLKHMRKHFRHYYAKMHQSRSQAMLQLDWMMNMLKCLVLSVRDEFVVLVVDPHLRDYQDVLLHLI